MAERLEQVWATPGGTILSAVEPILEGVGDIQQVHPVLVNEYLSILAGDLGLSRFEDKLSESWGKGFAGDPSSLRVTSSFFRIIKDVSEKKEVEVVLMDVGPNLGAINRAALLAADYLLIPLAADLFSLQGLRNLGPTLRTWRSDWQRTYDFAAPRVTFPLPRGNMHPLGYTVLQHAVRLDRPVKSYKRWLDRIPLEYERSVLGQSDSQLSNVSAAADPNCLSTIRNYRSLVPMAQDARKPMFDLRPADGAIGSHAQLVQTCFTEFWELTTQMLDRSDVSWEH